MKTQIPLFTLGLVSMLTAHASRLPTVPCAPEAGVYAMSEYSQDTGASEDMLDVVGMQPVGPGLFEVEVFFENGTDLEFRYYDVRVNNRCELKSIKEIARD